MGHTVEVFGEKHIVLHDYPVYLLARMMVEILKRDHRCYPALQAYRSDWDNWTYAHTPGVIELGIRDFESKPKVLAEFKDMLHEVEAMVREFGDAIPREEFRERWRIRGIFQKGDLKTEIMLDAIGQIRELVSE